MDNARQSLRYILPGLAAGAVFLFLWVFVAPGKLPGRLRLDNSDPVIAGLGAIVVSGGFGYLIAYVYFVIHWLPGEWFGPVDHREAATALRAAHPRWAESQIDGRSNSKRSAWILVTAWWFTEAGIDERIKAAHERAHSLMDHAHAAAIAGIGVMTAAVCWGWTVANKNQAGDCPTIGAGCIGAFLLAGLLFWNHMHTKRLFRAVVYQTIQRVLSEPIQRSKAG